MKRAIFKIQLDIVQLRIELNKDIFIDWSELNTKQHLTIRNLLIQHNYSPIDKSRVGERNTISRSNYLTLETILPQDTYTKEKPHL